MTAGEGAPTELRFVDRADVYKRGRLAGHLVRERTGVRFEYTDGYLTDPDAPAVATTLPRSATPVTTGSAGAVPPFFAGLLPEGRRLGALRRAVKTSADDELTLLLAVGTDTTGDVEVVRTGTAPGEADSAFVVSDWADVRFADLYAEMTGERLTSRRIGLAGVQEKASARMVSLPVSRAHERSILKLNPSEFPHLVDNEAFFLDAARRSGLPVASAEIVRDADGAAGLVVRRFDRVAVDGVPVMLAQEDACQVLARYPADKYSVPTDEMIGGLARVTGAPAVAARDLLRQLAFAYLTGNGDAHAKNFSILQAPDGEWWASPAYDLPSTYLYGDTTMALPIGGKTDERIGRADFVALGERVGVRRRATERMLDELLARVDLWLPGIEELPFDGRLLHKLRRNIGYRRVRLRSAT